MNISSMIQKYLCCFLCSLIFIIRHYFSTKLPLHCCLHISILIIRLFRPIFDFVVLKFIFSIALLLIGQVANLQMVRVDAFYIFLELIFQYLYEHPLSKSTFFHFLHQSQSQASHSLFLHYLTAEKIDVPSTIWEIEWDTVWAICDVTKVDYYSFRNR